VKPIRTGGENVFPDEVEAVLRYHPDVADAAVVGVADRLLGERLVALIQPAAGEAAPTVEELTEFCKARLVGYRVPRSVIPVDEIRRLAGHPDYDWARAVAAGAGSDGGKGGTAT
jgi:3-oxocholest-4-en-26-oate---CoA ligase